MILGDALVKLGLFGLFVWLLVVSRELPLEELGELGPGGWPRVLLIGLVVTTGMTLVQSVVQLARRRARADAAAAESSETLSSGQRLRLLLSFLMAAAYVFLLTRAGFMVSTVLVLIAAIRLMNYRNIVLTIIVPVAVVIILALLFGRLMYVPLPRGVGLFRAFSYLFY